MPGVGTIFLLGGTNDLFGVALRWKRHLAATGLMHHLIPIRWQLGGWSILTFADLRRTDHHRREADRLAARIREAQCDRPGEPIHVISHSAGTAVTCYAIEQLAPDEAITSVVFVGSALSPGYDLSPLLHRCHAGMLAIDSPLDLLFLGAGTRVFGTADRVRTSAAGRVGFDHNADAPSAKLHRLRWTPKQIRGGWFGGHMSITAPGFVRTVLATWIRDAERRALTQVGSIPEKIP